MGRGEWGEGSIGATIKGTRTKSRGRVEVGEGRGGGGRWDWLGWGGGKGRKCRKHLKHARTKERLYLQALLRNIPGNKIHRETSAKGWC